jgi:hypothetical protein
MNVNGIRYVATSTMPAPVPLDSIALQKVKSFSSTEVLVNAYFTNPANINNYFNLVEVYNGVAQTNNYVYNDQLLEGQSVVVSLHNRGNNLSFQSGDTVAVVLQCIDKNVYNYLEAFKQVMNASSLTTPANPPSNFSNGALGYFNACSVSQKSLIIP